MSVAVGGTGVEVAVAGSKVAVAGGAAVEVGVCSPGVPVFVGVGGAANPRIATTWSPPPNVENRKSPVSGSIAAPSAPVRPEIKTLRLAGSGSPLSLTVYVAIVPAEYSATSRLRKSGNDGDPGGT